MDVMCIEIENIGEFWDAKAPNLLYTWAIWFVYSTNQMLLQEKYVYGNMYKYMYNNTSIWFNMYTNLISFYFFWSLCFWFPSFLYMFTCLIYFLYVSIDLKRTLISVNKILISVNGILINLIRIPIGFNRT